MNGQVAEAFGALIERLWSSSGGAVAPREFKQALSKFAPSFSGYGQQDSQELLAFLLDGTHEDLNRIKVKPATSAPDWNGGDDRDMVELAKTCWEQYRSRNDSVIVDLFQGQYRSTVVCPDCDKVSFVRWRGCRAATDCFCRSPSRSTPSCTSRPTSPSRSCGPARSTSSRSIPASLATLCVFCVPSSYS